MNAGWAQPFARTAYVPDAEVRIPELNGAMRAVIFDIGGVLIGWKPELLYRKLIGDEDAAGMRAYFLAEVGRAPWEDRPVRDGAFDEGIRRLAERSPEHAAIVAQWHDPLAREMLNNDMEEAVLLISRANRYGAACPR